MAKSNFSGVKRQRYGRRYVYVAYDNGKRTSFRYVKGSDLTLNEAKELYKENKTFKRDVKRTEFKKVVEIVKTREVKRSKDGKFDLRGRPTEPKHIRAQYVVEGYVKKDKKSVCVVARSQSLTDGISKEEAKQKAWESFYEKVSETIYGNGVYDADEGIKHLNKITNLREGWVYYKEK